MKIDNTQEILEVIAPIPYRNNVIRISIGIRIRKAMLQFHIGIM